MNVVYLTIDPGDSRAKQLKITDKGVAVLREAYRIVQQVDDVFFSDLVKDKVISIVYLRD